MDRPLPGIQGYKRLLRILARTFYAGECPPRSEEEEEGSKPRSVKQNSTGLGVILLDYMASSKVDGYVDETTIASDLRLSQKNIRKALRYLEHEQLLSSESVKISMRRHNALLPDDPEVEEKKRQETRVYWCVDYCRVRDTVQLRLHLIRDALRRRISETAPLQTYICKRCGATYSSLDATRLIDTASMTFRCEDCGNELVEHVQGGPTAQQHRVGSRREAEAYYKGIQDRMEPQLRPLVEQLEKLKNTDPPDYGTLQDWYLRKKDEAEVRRKRVEAARKRAGNAGADMTEDELLDWADRAEVAVDLGEVNNGEGVDTSAAVAAPRELPAWFQYSEVLSIGATELSEEAAGGAEAVEEERRNLEHAYLQQYLAQVEAARAGGLSEEKPDAKRLKTEEGWNAVKEEAQQPLDEEIDWEDAD